MRLVRGDRLCSLATCVSEEGVALPGMRDVKNKYIFLLGSIHAMTFFKKPSKLREKLLNGKKFKSCATVYDLLFTFLVCSLRRCEKKGSEDSF